MVRTGIRASAIVVRDNKILLIHRKKEGRESIGSFRAEE